ncbi:MAG: SNF2-related protein [Lentisphaeria bacterium]|jgi:superfamily II DNA or RNA helicase
MDDFLGSTFKELRLLLTLIQHPTRIEELEQLSQALAQFFPQLATLSTDSWHKLISQAENYTLVLCKDGLCVNRDEHSEVNARVFLSQRKHAAVAEIVARVLASQADAQQARLRLARDLRNAFYAGDAELIKNSLNSLNQNYPESFATGEAFQFILPQLDDDWVQGLSHERLAICAWQAIPRLIAQMRDAPRFLKSLLNITAHLPQAALFPLADWLILRGQFSDAEKVLANCDGEAKKMRQAWLAFIRGRNSQAISMFIDTLYSIRHGDSAPDYYFQTVGGIFLIFALIKDNSDSSLAAAENNALLGSRVSTWSSVYTHLLAYIRKRNNRVEIMPWDPARRDGGLAAFFHLICDYWEQGSLGEGLLKRAESITRNAEEQGYAWIADQCRELQRRLQPGWTPDDTSQANAALDPSVLCILDCVEIQPPWLAAIRRLKELLKKPVNDARSRLVWFLDYRDEATGVISIKPMEQRQTKTGKWSKGRIFPLCKCVQTDVWPDYLSAQDLWACNVIGKSLQEQPSLMEGNPSTFVCQEAIKALADHPLLFWDEQKPTPISCVRCRPYLHIRSLADQFCLRLVPAPPASGRIVIAKDSDSSLRVYSFNEQCLRLAEALGEELVLPPEAQRNLPELLSKLSDDFMFLSDIPLDVLRCATAQAAEMPYLRLAPLDQGLKAELLFMPFKDIGRYYPPATGPIELVTKVNARLLRVRRDGERERDLAEKILASCPALHQATPGAHDRSWVISSPMACYDFALQLHDVSGFCQVQWPEGSRLKVSRAITHKDLVLRTQRQNDWFAISGEVRVNENLTLSLQEILRAGKNRQGNYITLEDGQVIALADSFRRRLEELQNLGELRGDHFRLHRFSLPVAEQLLAEFSGFERSVAWQQQVGAIAEAMRLVPVVPAELQARLRSYQREGFIWLSRLDAWGAGACLADDMGLGKTLQAITMILSKTQEGPALVIAPTSVCHNWLLECQRFAPSLEVSIFGNGDRQQQLAAMGPGQVLICSYGLLQSENAAFQKVRWRVAVLDEAQAIKNYQAKRSQAALKINAQFRMVTTGTPVENNLNELWVIFHFINPGLLGSRDSFQKRFAVPIEKENNRVVAQQLNALLRPFLLRRRKTQVLPELPPKTEVSLYVELSESERAFYEALRRELIAQVSPRNGEDATQLRIRVLAAITKLRMAACNPRLVQAGLDIASAKMGAFSELLDELLSSGHKALVFSQFVRHLDLVRPLLDEKGVRYQYLDGSTSSKDRSSAVEAFQAGESDLFLISLRAGGLGLNLTEADYVVHLDPWWNPAVEDQASDRAHRLGQTKPVTIYRLIAKDTIEAKILDLHQHKRDLADQLLAGSDQPSAISAEELLRLLTEH